MKKALLTLVTSFLFTSSLLAQVPDYVPTEGLVGYWPFNGNANDESGNGNHGTVNGGISLTTDRFNNSNGAFQFPGTTNAFINCGNNSSLQVQSSLSMCAWIFMSGGYFNPRILSYEQSGYKGYGMNVVGTNSGTRNVQTVFYQNGGSGSGFCCAGNAGVNVTTSEWHHIVCTIDQNGNAVLYIDGILSKTFQGNAVTTGTYGPTASLNIGRLPFPAYDAWGGKLDEIAIYNRALSAEEVNALYTGVPYVTTILGCTNTNACNYNAAATQDDGSCTFPAQTYLNCAGTCLNDANSNGICDEVEATLPSYLPANGLVAWYPFNGNANDESGNGNHGTVNGATLTADRNGNANSAYSFDGIANFITTSIPFNDINNVKTVSFNLKLNSYPSSDQNLLVGVSNGKPQFVIRNDGKIRVQKNTPYNYFDIIESPTSIDVGTWYQITGIYNQNEILIYINGSLVISSNFNNPAFYQCSDIPFQIGGFNYNTTCGGNYSDQFVNSIIDDIAIYNRALTQEEITALYNGTTDNNSGNNNNTATTTVPAGISYQAVARNAQGTALANTAIQVKFTLITDSLSGSNEYVETHSLSTNSMGLFATAFGTGTAVSGTWAGINWTHSNKYLKVELDAGNGFVDLGTQQLLSSPFAIRAQSAATIENGALPVYTDNAAAIAGGLTVGKLYRTATGELKVVY